MTKKESIWYVYSHTRLDINEIFYIGIGSIKNYARAYRKNCRSQHWKNIVNKADYKVEILNDLITEDKAKEIEIDLIKQYGRTDLKEGNLYNKTDGGEGTCGIVITKRQRAAISKRNKGYKHTPEAIEKIREAAANISKETREKMSKARKGKKRDLSDEARQKISDAATNLSDETRAKRSKALKGRKFSEEIKKKMREAALRRHAKKSIVD